MARANITTHNVLEDGGFVVMTRIRGNDGNLITQANVSAIIGHVYDLRVETPGSVDLWNQVLAVADTIFDTLQTTSDDPRWTRDDIGFNFRSIVPSTTVPNPSRYRCEIVISPASGDPFVVPLDLQAIGILSS